MKTRVIITLTTVVVASFLLGGCAGQIHGALQTDTGEPITHNAWSASLLLPPPGPIELAESYRIKKQADAYSKMMAGLQEGKTVAAGNGKFLIGLINNSHASVYVYHPEMPGLKLTADSNGGFQVFEVRDMPYEIAVYRSTGKLARQIRPRYEPDYQEKLAHKKLVGNMLVDFVIKVNGTY